MSEAKHTSGPWYVEPCGVSDCWCATVVTVQHSDLMDDCVIPAGSVRKEDAPLIAAAPELLEALHNLLDGIERTSCTCHQAYTGRGLRDPDCQRCHLDIGPDELDAARAAIAKATGAAQ